jgi:hypothetical protein
MDIVGVSLNGSSPNGVMVFYQILSQRVANSAVISEVIINLYLGIGR